MWVIQKILVLFSNGKVFFEDIFQLDVNVSFEPPK